jgi:hypothetical protein
MIGEKGVRTGLPVSGHEMATEDSPTLASLGMLLKVAAQLAVCVREGDHT